MRSAVPFLALQALGLVAGTARADDLHTVFFAGLDAGHSLHAHAGFKHALGGSLDRDGWLVLGTIGAGESGGDRGRKGGGAVLGGYQWSLPRLHMAVFAGPELQRDGGLRAGLRGQGEVWARPTDATLLTATVIAGTARAEVWGRVSAGYRVVDEVFVGPEASAKRERGWHEWRAGLHVTGPTFAGITWRLSGGRMWAESGREGFYGALSGHVRLGQ